MSKRLLGFMFLLALAFTLTACGSKKATFDVEMKEFSFTPNEITVQAGTEVTLNLTNTGALQHDFVIMVLGKEATAPFDADDESNIYWQQKLEKGDSVTATFTAPSEPGTYQIVCGTPAHLEQGMKATLTVTK